MPKKRSELGEKQKKEHKRKNYKLHIMSFPLFPQALLSFPHFCFSFLIFWSFLEKEAGFIVPTKQVG